MTAVDVYMEQTSSTTNTDEGMDTTLTLKREFPQYSGKDRYMKTKLSFQFNFRELTMKIKDFSLSSDLQVQSRSY